MKMPRIRTGPVMSRRGCSVICCDNTYARNPDKRFFRFPTNPERNLKWVYFCKNPVLQGRSVIKLNCNSIICQDHFEDRCFFNITKHKLVHDAVPTICLEDCENDFHQGDSSSGEHGSDPAKYLFPTGQRSLRKQYRNRSLSSKAIGQRSTVVTIILDSPDDSAGSDSDDSGSRRLRKNGAKSSPKTNSRQLEYPGSRRISTMGSDSDEDYVPTKLAKSVRKGSATPSSEPERQSSLNLRSWPKRTRKLRFSNSSCDWETVASSKNYLPVADEASTYGNHVTKRLRNLVPLQASCLKKLIDNLFRFADEGSLGVNTQIVNVEQAQTDDSMKLVIDTSKSTKDDSYVATTEFSSDQQQIPD